MSILMLGLLECLFLAGLVLVIANARRLPPKRAGLAAALLVTAALIAEVYGITLIVNNGYALAAAAAAKAANRQTNTAERTPLQGAAGSPVQPKAHGDRGDNRRPRGKPR